VYGAEAFPTVNPSLIHASRTVANITLLKKFAVMTFEKMKRSAECIYTQVSDRTIVKSYCVY
jgi:hypothetical protein